MGKKEKSRFRLVEQKVREQVNSHFLSLYIRKINLHGVRGVSHGHLVYTPTTSHLKVRVANSGINIVSLYKIDEASPRLHPTPMSSMQCANRSETRLFVRASAGLSSV